MGENLYIKSHRYGNKRYRKNYDSVFRVRKPLGRPTVSHRDRSKYTRKVKHGLREEETLEEQIKEEAKKGKVLGHFM